MQSKLYSVWAGMKQRCFNQRCKIFPHYGGRGITVCDDWSAPNGFYAFEKWAMENGYREGLTIDRYPDRDGNYEPSNCRWVTRTENLRNRCMTPAWRGAIAKMLAAPRRYTPAMLAAGRRNMAKARASARKLKHSQAQIEAAKRNLPVMWAAQRAKREQKKCNKALGMLISGV